MTSSCTVNKQRLVLLTSERVRMQNAETHPQLLISSVCTSGIAALGNLLRKTVKSFRHFFFLYQTLKIKLL